MNEGAEQQGHSRGTPQLLQVPHRCDPGLPGGRGAAEEPLVVAVGTGTVLFIPTDPRAAQLLLLEFVTVTKARELGRVWEPALQPQPSPCVDFPVPADS